MIESRRDFRVSLSFTAAVFLFASCAGDIKGEAGEPGKDHLHRPWFQSELQGSQVVVVVPGETDLPARIYIDDTEYENSEPARCDLSLTGRAGLDIPPFERETSYYLYAVPSLTPPAFDLVASKKSPVAGPDGFSSWSYIGAFASGTHPTLLPFFFSRNGEYWTSSPVGANPVTATTEWVSISLPTVPETAYAVHGTASVSGTAPGEAYFSGKIPPGGAPIFSVFLPVTTDDAPFTQQGTLPLFETRTIYQMNSSAGVVSFWSTNGWSEDPTEWQ